MQDKQNITVTVVPWAMQRFWGTGADGWETGSLFRRTIGRRYVIIQGKMRKQTKMVVGRLVHFKDVKSTGYKLETKIKISLSKVFYCMGSIKYQFGKKKKKCIGNFNNYLKKWISFELELLNRLKG